MSALATAIATETLRVCARCKTTIPFHKNEIFRFCALCSKSYHTSCMGTKCECGADVKNTMLVLCDDAHENTPKWGTFQHAWSFFLWTLSPSTFFSALKLLFYVYALYLVLGFQGKLMAFYVYASDNALPMENMVHFFKLALQHSYEYRWTSWRVVNHGDFLDAGPVHMYHALLCSTVLLTVAVMYYMVAWIGNKIMRTIRKT